MTSHPRLHGSDEPPRYPTDSGDDIVTIPPNADFGPQPPPPPTVVVRIKVGMGNPKDDHIIAWPREWSRPIVGQVLRYNDQVLRVRDITFDLDDNRTILDCE